MCCVVKMSKGVEEKKKRSEKQGQYVACAVQENMFFSRDIWLHQLEILHRRCDKCLYSQFTSFCFSLLLDCSLASSSPHVCFSHFSLSLPRHFSSCVGACAATHTHTHTKAQSLTKLIIGKIHSWSNSYPKTSWQTLKHPCDLCVCVCVCVCVFSQSNLYFMTHHYQYERSRWVEERMRLMCKTLS